MEVGRTLVLSPVHTKAALKQQHLSSCLVTLPGPAAGAALTNDVESNFDSVRGDYTGAGCLLEMRSNDAHHTQTSNSRLRKGNNPRLEGGERATSPPYIQITDYRLAPSKWGAREEPTSAPWATIEDTLSS
jgi:hypothetical protein